MDILRNFCGRDIKNAVIDSALKAALANRSVSLNDLTDTINEIQKNRIAEEYKKVNVVILDRANYKEDVQYLSSIHILTQKHKWDEWFNSNDSMTEARCLLILCNRLISMLGKQIETLLSSFREEGGFTEGLTAERLAYRTEKSIQSEDPICPKCGKPMIT